jgi:flagellin-like hook-associated protein FlgL
MRSTLLSINRNAIFNLNKLASELQSINQKISSGKEMSSPSDDPVNLVGVLGLRSNIEEIKQYQQNLNYGQNIIIASESALSQIKGLLTEGRTLALAMANGSVSAENRASTAQQVQNLLELAVTLGNTQNAGKFVFGGYRTTGYTNAEPAPFMVDTAQGYRLNGNGMAPTSLATGDLVINGLAIDATVADGFSDVSANASAAAKATAINLMADATGVRAAVVPVSHMAGAGVEAGSMGVGDLVINGMDIFNLVDFPAGATVVTADTDNVVMAAINAQQDTTGVVATRDSAGRLLLAATDGDGRNLHVVTSANGEQLTHLNDPTLAFPAVAQDQVYFGSLQLSSGKIFSIETPLAAEAGLAAIGLAGGQALTGEAGDVAGDGRIVVDDVTRQAGSVRYTGDPVNDLEIKVGRSSTLAVGRNGQDGLMDTGLFDAFTKLNNALRAQDYTTSTGQNEATSLGVTLATGGTGLAAEDEVVAGNFTVTVTDNAYYPPRPLTIDIGIDPTTDTLASMAKKLDGIPGLQASWDSDGYLQITSSDPTRYGFTLAGDSSNFLKAVGMRGDDMQVAAIQGALSNFDVVFNSVSNAVSDFGARSNRVDAQRSIFSDLELAATSNLSQREDVDFVKALSDLATKQTAFEAALNATAKAMKLSLMDFL